MTIKKYTEYSYAIVKGGSEGELKLVTYSRFNDLSYLDKMALVEDLKKEVNNLYRLVVKEQLNKGQKELDL